MLCRVWQQWALVNNDDSETENVPKVFFFGKSINQLINQSTRRKFENFFSWIRQFHFKRTRLLPSCPSPPPSRPKTRPGSATTARGGTTRPCNSAASARCTDRRCYTWTRRWSATPSGVNVAKLFFLCHWRRGQISYIVCNKARVKHFKPSLHWRHFPRFRVLALCSATKK